MMIESLQYYFYYHILIDRKHDIRFGDTCMLNAIYTFLHSILNIDGRYERMLYNLQANKI